MTDTQIPDEVTAAVEAVLSRYLVGGYTLSDKESIANIIVNAALAAWPGAWPYKYHDDGSLSLILPLTQEKNDD